MEDKHVFMPQVDILEKENSYELYADMPGIDSNRIKDDVSVEMDKGVLNISGKLTVNVNQFKNSQNEFLRGEYRRNIKFDENLISPEISGQYANGVLHITLPKKKEAKQKISVQVV